MKSSVFMPDQPKIEINPSYNPFEREERSTERSGYVERFERENTANWEKLYSALEKQEDNPEKYEKIQESQRKFFQIKNKYFVCPVKSGLMIIDQKRAHERVLYERFLECLSTNRSISQVDMFPVTVELNPSDYFILKEIEEELVLLGFSFEHPGKNTIIIIGRPAESVSADPVEMLEILFEDYKTTEAEPSISAKEKIAAGMASASAIQYGKAMSQGEMENLFDTLFSCKSPNYSPKGKPVITIISLDDIDKKFKPPAS
jgi:DNA mismatch repair protein MutL